MAKSFSNKWLSSLSLYFLITLEVSHSKAMECGSTLFASPLIAHGRPTQRGEWPFLTALLLVDESTFFCGGNLISDKHILTAAHCIIQKSSRSRLLPADIYVRLGAYDLTLRNETEVLQRNVRNIYLHHDWDVNSKKYDADLAVLLLSENVTFTHYIRPVCMPADNDVVYGARGSVIGWGSNENGTNNLEYIKRASVTVLNVSYCYTEDYIVAEISSIRTFCGQGEDGTPNQGDSGGGFYVLSGSSWVQYGIVSSLRKNTGNFIDPNAVTVYTNVIEFKSWIVETVAESGSAVAEAKMTEDININLKCRYSYYFEENGIIYGCWLFDVDLQDANAAVASFTGVHRRFASDQNVQLIQFFNGTMIFLPSKIGKLFTSLTHFEINEGLRTKFIRRSQLKNLENLISLGIMKNDIDTLDKYALWDLPNLENFGLQYNNLREIDGKTFEKNLKLRNISLISNQVSVLPRNLFQFNSILENVNLGHNNFSVIDENIFATNVKLNSINLSSNQLEVLPINLFKNNPLLKYIFLGHNAIEVIDGKIFERNEVLRKVNLFSNQLEALPWNLFQNNSLLWIVSLGHNLLKVIDGRIFERNAILREVNISSNQLEVLPWNLFQNNSLLEIVSLDNNSLKEIDERIFSTIKNLRNVFLNSNQLEVLPWNLYKNNSLLEGVYLHHNGLKGIDKRIFENNSNLRVVDLTSNQIDVLPWNLFLNNTLIEILVLTRNFLKVIDERIFLTIERLKTLYLDSNQLEILPPNLLRNNLLLEVVQLQENKLKIINEGTFDKTINLRQLYLYSNQLETIPRNLLKNNLFLEIVKFTSNSLKSIDERSFETNVRLLGVYLANNQLEILPKNLFTNNLLLEDVNFSYNLLKIIEIDFTGFSHIKLIHFYQNSCIDAYYEGVNPITYRNQFRNLTEFLGLVRTNCSRTSS